MAQIVQRDILSQHPSQPTVPVTVGMDYTVIVQAIDLLRFDRKTFTLQNTGATALSACLVEVSPKAPGESADADYETVDSTTFATLGAGAILSFQVGIDSHRTFRIRGKVAAGSTTVIPYVTAGAI